MRVLALGADACYSARAMMMALGCIQALECNHNTCPVGVATQDKTLAKGLDPTNKRVRVKNFHERTIESFVEMLGAAGLSSPAEVDKKHIFRRVEMHEVRSYEELYPEA